MVENLKTTKYKDGTAIPNITDVNAWYGLSSGAYSNYNNDLGNFSIYGRLYNHYAVMNPKGLCPSGWHVPSDIEWKQLEINVGMPSAQAEILKAFRGTAENIGTKLKVNGNSGFNVKLSGNRGWYAPIDFKEIDIYGFFWTTTIGIEYPITNAFTRAFKDSESGVWRSEGNIHSGNSVRCIKDN
jgi:uncharacterized protein (TIGR02145 family)